MPSEMMSSVWIGTTCFGAIVTALIVCWLIQKRKNTYPPGPPALPLIGNLLQVNFENMHEQAFEWSKKYGPVITIRLGTTPFIFVNSTDTALEVLVERSTDFASRIFMPSIDLYSYGGKNIVASNYGPTWKLHRKIASKALRKYLQGDALEQRLFDAENAAFVEIDKASGPFDPGQYIDFILTNILSSMCFAEKYDVNDEEMRFMLKVNEELAERFIAGVPEDFIPGLRYIFKSTAFIELEKCTDLLMEGFIRRKFKQAETTFNKDFIRHFSDDLTLTRIEAEKEKEQQTLNALDEDHLIQTLADIYFSVFG